MSATDAATSKKILYIDLDNTLVDFKSGIDRLTAANVKKYAGSYDDTPGIFALMEPMTGAIDAYKLLAEAFDTYILSTAPWNNPSAWQDKLEWVQLHLGIAAGTPAYKRLILSHHKNLNRGDFLVDDRPNNGASEFEGKLLLFGQPPYSTWAEVTEYLLTREPATAVPASA
jgi:5'(3')-deoxyribonucleotidase